MPEFSLLFRCSSSLFFGVCILFALLHTDAPIRDADLYPCSPSTLFDDAHSGAWLFESCYISFFFISLLYSRVNETAVWNAQRRLATRNLSLPSHLHLHIRFHASLRPRVIRAILPRSSATYLPFSMNEFSRKKNRTELLWPVRVIQQAVVRREMYAVAAVIPRRM